MKSALRSKLSALVSRRIRVERRNCKRVVPAQRAVCTLQARGEDPPATGHVQDLSVKGVSVVVEREIPTGAHVEICLVNASHTFSVIRGVNVVRCLRLGSGQYFVAGPFDQPLAHDEVVPFLL